MTHIAFDDLSAYIDEEVPPDEKRRIEEHLAGCRVCRDELASLSWSVDFTRALPRAQVPLGVSFHVPAPDDSPRGADTGRSRGFLAALATGSLALAAVVVAVALQQTVMRSAPVEQSAAITGVSAAPDHLEAPAPAIRQPEAAASGRSAAQELAEPEAADLADAFSAASTVDPVGGESVAAEAPADQARARALAEAAATAVATVSPPQPPASVGAPAAQALPAATAAGTGRPTRPRTAAAPPIEVRASGRERLGWLAVALVAVTVAAGAWALRRGGRG